MIALWSMLAWADPELALARAHAALAEERGLSALEHARAGLREECTTPSLRAALFSAYARAGEAAGMGREIRAEMERVDAPEAAWVLLGWEGKEGELMRSAEPSWAATWAAGARLREGAPLAALAALGGAEISPRVLDLTLEASVLARDNARIRDALAVAQARYPEHPEVLRGLWADSATMRRQKRTIVRHIRREAVSADALYLWRARALLLEAREPASELVNRLRALGEPPALPRPLWNTAMRGAVSRALLDTQTPWPEMTAAEAEAVAEHAAAELGEGGDALGAAQIWARARAAHETAETFISEASWIAKGEGQYLTLAGRGLYLASLPSEVDGAAMDLRLMSQRFARGWALRGRTSADAAAVAALFAGTLERPSGAPPEALLRAEVLFREGHSADALAALDGLAAASAGQRGTVSTLLWLQGRIFRELGQREEGMVRLTSALLLHPSPPSSWVWLRGVWLEEAGHQRAAFSWFAAGASGEGFPAMERVWVGLGEVEDGAVAHGQRWWGEKGKTAVWEEPAEFGPRKPAAGTVFPEWEVTVDGERLRGADLAGRVVILAFWASWCEPCQEELPALSALARAAREEGLPLEIVAISLDESPRDFARGRARLDLTGLRVAHAPSLGARLGVSSLPTTWLLDADGQAIRRTTGYRSGQIQELEAEVHSLLNREE